MPSNGRWDLIRRLKFNYCVYIVVKKYIFGWKYFVKNLAKNCAVGQAHMDATVCP